MFGLGIFGAVLFSFALFFGLVGILIFLGVKILNWARFPEDTQVKGKKFHGNFRIFFPVGLSLLLSLILTVLANMIILAVMG